MNIALTGTKITQDTKFLAFEKNNSVDVINVIVDTDESWTYKLDVRYPDKCCTSEPLYNIINLTRNGNLCTAIFTSDMLPFAGKYTMQLRGINGDKVSHSDVFDTWVKYSIEPGSTYNPVPSEFYQIEQNITEINNHPPYPDISGFWMIWNSQTNKYELSDIPAVTASDIGAIPVPTTAEVGQTIVVKAVDDTGKPTEWEPATLPEQAQADWMQSDDSYANYVKNRTHYSRMQFIARARHYSGSQYQTFPDIPTLTNIEPICIEINGTLHTDLFGNTLMGDSDSSVWENGGGMGFYIKHNGNDYLIYIDTNRYGPIKDATINLYSQVVEKVLPSYYLPVATFNTLGGVKAAKKNDMSDYIECVIDTNGILYSKSYNAAKVYSELSITNLTATSSYNGEHGLFIDSIAEEFQSYGLTLPVHSWYIGFNFSTYSQKYILESADGITMLIQVKNSAITSASILVEPSSGGSFIVTSVDNTHASHTPTEINEAFQSGKTVQFDADGIVLQLSALSDDVAIFNGSVAINGEVRNVSVIVNNAAEINMSQYKLYPATADTVILPSSTEGSNKRFEITVDDSGTISATEVV